MPCAAILYAIVSLKEAYKVKLYIHIYYLYIHVCVKRCREKTELCSELQCFYLFLKKNSSRAII